MKDEIAFLAQTVAVDTMLVWMAVSAVFGAMVAGPIKRLAPIFRRNRTVITEDDPDAVAFGAFPYLENRPLPGSSSINIREDVQ